MSAADSDEPEPLLPEVLLGLARQSAQKAGEVLAEPCAPAHAASWLRATREALEARRIAEEPLSDGERAATAEHVKALREKNATAEQALGDVVGQRDELAVFLGTMAGEFESAQTDTAGRVAARIRRLLAEVFPAADERDDGEPQR